MHGIGAVLVSWCAGPRAFAQDPCPGGALATAKSTSLYLYYPTSSDSSFPSWTALGIDTSPAEDFDAADLDSGIGTSNQVRNRITELVRNDYCEFSVDVSATTTAPSPTESQWQVIAVGSDSNGIGLFGVAEAVDTDNADPQDYARVWAGEFGSACSGSLSGTNSTRERWSRGIASTVAHEAGHNFGLAHGNSAPVAGSGEDGQDNHLLATGSTGLTCNERVSLDRHFSDTSFGILAHNLGLNLKTLHNWDFVNPNDTDAHSMKIIVLSKEASLSVGWWYNGSLSPWRDPTIASTGASRTFHGEVYNEFELTFSTPKSWSGGANGVAPGGVEFHTGASFPEDGAVIVYETRLFDSSGTQLPLAPRIFGYDSGVPADTTDGTFELTFFNAANIDLELRDVRIVGLARQLSLEAMVPNAEMTSRRGARVATVRLPRVERRKEPRGIRAGESMTFGLARLTDPRPIDIRYSANDCPQGSVGASGDLNSGEVEYCKKGNALSLFPATYVYVVATVVERNAKVWSPERREFVTRDLESRIYYQRAGIKPDLNDNGLDDLLDIREGRSKDGNENGIPDEAEQRKKCDCNRSRSAVRGSSAATGLLGLTLLLGLASRRRRRP
ncbi:MAG: hypothetical protein RIT81_15645 [Deltaproteobacteria bacterium]